MLAMELALRDREPMITHIWSQGPRWSPTTSEWLERLPRNVYTFCGLSVRRDGVWDTWAPVLTAEFLFHLPVEDRRVFCRSCVAYLAAHPIVCVCRGEGGPTCKGAA